MHKVSDAKKLTREKRMLNILELQDSMRDIK